VPVVLCCSWFWLYDALEVDRDVKAAPLPIVESAEPEVTEDDEDIEDKDPDEAGSKDKDKKKKVGFRDRKVVRTSCSDSKPFLPHAPFSSHARILYPLSKIIRAALCNRAGDYIFDLWFLLLSFFLLFLTASTQPSQIGCLPYFHTWCSLSANLGCTCETYCLRLDGNAGRKNHKKFTISAPSHNFVGYIFRTKACIDNRKKTC